MAPSPGRTGMRKRFTQAEVAWLEKAGLFEGQRFELIEGDLIDKMGQNPPHAYAIRRLASWLAQIFGLSRLMVQSPVQVARADRELSLPEPDISIVSEDSRAYADRHPRGDELLLAVEVADSSLRLDSTVKRNLYARAGVPEYWILDLSKQRMIVHRRPVSGEYLDVFAVESQDTISPANHELAAVPLATVLA